MRNANFPTNRGDVDNAALFAFQHMGQNGHCSIVCSPEDNIHRLLEIFSCQRAYWPGGNNARVVDDDIYLPKPVKSFLYQLLYLIGVSYITLYCEYCGFRRGKMFLSLL